MSKERISGRSDVITEEAKRFSKTHGVSLTTAANIVDEPKRYPGGKGPYKSES